MSWSRPGRAVPEDRSFLLPIFARLLEESKTWDSSGSLYRWWDPAQREEAWRPSRSLFKRPAAIRAVVLYPTNALVEDQIARLRAAIRRIRNRGGPDLFFGRYTGGTIGGASGTPSRSREDRVQSAAQELLAMERDLDEMVDQSEEVTSQFPDPRTGEMTTRWDMIGAPPDILVTNYSMLNVILMRENEAPMFDATRAWLHEDPSRTITMVVDELHGYRGTQGSEVALVLRGLVSRLGLPADSDQLRCIGTSASLDSDGGKDYLEQFFGVDKATFSIVPGTPIPPPKPRPLPRNDYSEAAARPTDSRSERLSELLRENDVRASLAAACRAGDGTRATPISDINHRLFSEDGPIEDGALAAALEAVVLDDAPGDRFTFRSHMFVRMIGGMWACADPECSAVVDAAPESPRGVGKLFTIPAETCKCGGVSSSSTAINAVKCHSAGS